jgi:GTP-binding protein
MAFQKAEFITSAPALKDCPEESIPEFCFAGRSNVGKSSLINRVTEQKKAGKNQ